jgi:hypothetical protein
VKAWSREQRESKAQQLDPRPPAVQQELMERKSVEQRVGELMRFLPKSFDTSKSPELQVLCCSGRMRTHDVQSGGKDLARDEEKNVGCRHGFAVEHGVTNFAHVIYYTA